MKKLIKKQIINELNKHNYIINMLEKNISNKINEKLFILKVKNFEGNTIILDIDSFYYNKLKNSDKEIIRFSLTDQNSLKYNPLEELKDIEETINFYYYFFSLIGKNNKLYDEYEKEIYINYASELLATVTLILSYKNEFEKGNSKIDLENVFKFVKTEDFFNEGLEYENFLPFVVKEKINKFLVIKKKNKTFYDSLLKIIIAKFEFFFNKEKENILKNIKNCDFKINELVNKKNSIIIFDINSSYITSTINFYKWLLNKIIEEIKLKQEQKFLLVFDFWITNSIGFDERIFELKNINLILYGFLEQLKMQYVTKKSLQKFLNNFTLIFFPFSKNKPELNEKFNIYSKLNNRLNINFEDIEKDLVPVFKIKIKNKIYFCLLK